MNPRLTAHELEVLRGAAGVVGLGVAGAQAAPALAATAATQVLGLSELSAATGTVAAPAMVEGDAAALVLFTSGTTGTPKAIPLTTSMLRERVLLYSPEVDEAPLVTLACTPLAHVGGVMPILNSLAKGSTVVVQQRFEPGRWLEPVEIHRVTNTFVVPTMLHRIVGHPSLEQRDLSSMQLLVFGAAPASPDLIRRVQAGLPRGGRGQHLRPDRDHGFAHPLRSLRSAAGAARLGRSADAGRRGSRRGSGDRPGPSRGRGRRALGQDPHHGDPGRAEGRPAPAGGLVSHRRPGQPGRGGLPLPHGPTGRHHQPGRREVPTLGDRGRGPPAPGRGRRRGRRTAGRRDGHAASASPPSSRGRSSSRSSDASARASSRTSSCQSGSWSSTSFPTTTSGRSTARPSGPSPRSARPCRASRPRRPARGRLPSRRGLPPARLTTSIARSGEHARRPSGSGCRSGRWR